MAFWKNDDSFAPFNVPQVGPTIPAMPTPDAKDAEIAKLRADLDQARRDRNSAVECAEVLRGYVAEHKAALAAARAALDGEREQHDETQRALNLGIEFAFDAADGRPGLDTACEIIAAHDARRAAEAKASRGGEGKP